MKNKLKTELESWVSGIKSPFITETPGAPVLPPLANSPLADELLKHLTRIFHDFPWAVVFKDWEGRCFEMGGSSPHWSQLPLEITVKTENAARAILKNNGLEFLDRFIQGEAELDGNLYILPEIRKHLGMSLTLKQKALSLLHNSAYQNLSRTVKNVKSHYDIPPETLDAYLDKTYLSYSCAIFESTEIKSRDELVRKGEGERDDFDSLEKAQWRKYKDAVDFIRPLEGETLIDIGCGYGGQLMVALENHPFGKVVGWTCSNNQVLQGSRMLSKFPRERWEMNEGDYRDDHRIFDHVTSTGMVSHVGPRGLVPYVKNVRCRIKKGGRYLHHALMQPYTNVPLNFQLGRIFHKKYVWPGFHWFHLGDHMKALEEHGFEVQKVVNLSDHYGKTIAAWYERFMDEKELMHDRLGDATYRAWRVYLGGSSGEITHHKAHVYRIYCTAV